tara:strand:- start:486 stop:758 length:273 start_codon:yes stop_codon:yes gene_type:complete
MIFNKKETTFLLSIPVEQAESWHGSSEDSIGELSTIHDDLADELSDGSIEIEIIESVAEHAAEVIDQVMAELGGTEVEDFFKNHDVKRWT